MKKYFDKYRIAGIVIFILFILCILTVTLIHINPGYEHMVPAVNSFAILEPASVDEDVISGYAGVRIQDDGKGFSASPVEAEGGNDIHVGLNNVRERLKMMCNGQLTITPAETGGSVITIIIPPSHPGTNEYSGAVF